MLSQQAVLYAAGRGVRLAGFSVALAVLAGAGGRVYAAAPAQAATAAEPAATASAPAADPAAAQPATATAQPEDAPAQAGAPAAAAQPAGVKTVAQVKDKKAKKVKKKKEKPPKLVPMHIAEGTLTVDGWTGKARLNYDIADLKYIYVWAPGIGTIVASNEKFPMAKEEPGAFNLNNLTLDAGGHTVQISSDNRLLKNKKPVSAWVYLDTTYHRNSKYPEMGYGPAKDAPYAWPGAKQVALDKTGSVDAPPLPAGLSPTIAKPVCVPAPAAAVPGQPAPAANCPAAVPAAKPASTPPVPLPGYKSGTTTAEVIATPAK